MQLRLRVPSLLKKLSAKLNGRTFSLPLNSSTTFIILTLLSISFVRLAMLSYFEVNACVIKGITCKGGLGSIKKTHIFLKK